MAESIPYQSFFRLDTGTHTKPIHQMGVSADGSLLVTAGETALRVWDLQTRKPLRLLLGDVTDPAALFDASGNIVRFALSHDGRWVVALRSRIKPGSTSEWLRRYTQLQFYELATGDLRAGFDYPGMLFDLDFSPDDQYLATTGQAAAAGPARGTIEVYSTKGILAARFKQTPVPLATLEVNQADSEAVLTSALRFLPPVSAASRASRDYRLVWAARHPKPKAKLGGHLGWFAFSSAGGLRELARIETEFIINPATLAVGPVCSVIAPHIDFAKPSSERQFFSYDHDDRRRNGMATEARPATLVFTPGGNQLLVGMAAEAEPGVKVVRACVFDIVGADGTFERRSTYYGHDDSVAAAAFLRNGTVVSAGGDNHALHLWSPAHSEGEALAVIRGVGREVHRVGITCDETIGFDTLPDRLLGHPDTRVQRIFDLRTSTLRARSAVDQGPFEQTTPKWSVLLCSQTINLKSTMGRDVNDEAQFEEALTPDLSLFVGADDEWVIWSRSGYYNASPHGARHVGFHVNRGAKREALFFPSDRIKAFYRPDIIQAVMEHGSEALARAKGAKIPALDVVAHLPPVIEMAKGGTTQESDLVSFSFTVRSLQRGKPVTRVWILQNDLFVWSADAIKTEYAVSLQLRPGHNAFAIMAETADAKAVPLLHAATGPARNGVTSDVAQTERTAAGKPKQGNLYLLSVGVSDFEVAGSAESKGFKKLAFAHLDAIAIRNALVKGGDSSELVDESTGRNLAFKAVEATLLLDKFATKAAIFSEVMRLRDLLRTRSQVDNPPRDVLFVFLAGHGVRYKGEPDLYYWNWDLRPAKLSATGLSLIELGRIVTSVPAEVVLAIDACYSGGAGADVVRGLDPAELASRIQAVNERGMYILNATRSEERAYEDPDFGHGFFTKAILDTLRLETSLLTDQKIRKERTVNMMGLMAGVQQLVPYYTTQKQAAVCRTYGDLLELDIFKA